MCGASAQQTQIAAEQQANFNQMSNQAAAVFGDTSKVFSELQSSFAPILAAGPGQSGFTAPELANLQSQAVTAGGVATRNAQQAAGERAAAAGGGTTVLPSGAAMGQEANIAEAGAQATANQLSNINLENAQLGQQNWMNAAGILGGAANTFNASTGAGSAATGSGSAAMSGANDVHQANGQLTQDILGVAESGAGVAGSILCPAEGSLYLMADGSEKPVENLEVGELIAGDDGASEITEIHSEILPVIQVCTENGFITRNSITHCFKLSAGGFTLAIQSLGKTVATASGSSIVTKIELAGTARVFSIVTTGNHTYRASGVWAYGVGDAVSDEACKAYLKELTMVAAGGR